MFEMWSSSTQKYYCMFVKSWVHQTQKLEQLQLKFMTSHWSSQDELYFWTGFKKGYIEALICSGTNFNLRMLSRVQKFRATNRLGKASFPCRAKDRRVANMAESSKWRDRERTPVKEKTCTRSSMLSSRCRVVIVQLVWNDHLNPPWLTGRVWKIKGDLKLQTNRIICSAISWCLVQQTLAKKKYYAFSFYTFSFSLSMKK